MMDPAIAPLSGTLHLNTALFVNCLAEVDDTTALVRPNERTNNLIFVAAHLVEARHYLATVLTVANEPPFGGALREAGGLDELRVLPSVSGATEAWLEISEKLASRFGTLTTDELGAPVDSSFPGGETTVVGAVAFLLQHESYHIGQMGLIRKFHGLEPMRYDA